MNPFTSSILFSISSQRSTMVLIVTVALVEFMKYDCKASFGGF
ncbi:hypothetical protein ZEAMMB73_Zm00001d002640 [Zea mays]|uniref:Uncharacterized protein n=1 Tax=Zea mays TaxID=4577 RepID=A0A1D6E2N2_MAIZE|nr:hypothetical protein ZEAMMB73_Zm00001d002640 [Zea mays]ONM14868.1 hypothetical protein ZEAMMB73_Zm00001d002640 [Zea mays]ONM14871.1 hypothetical protein ZEAMMB73_Zm00001d002640 [Zea mays]